MNKENLNGRNSVATNAIEKAIKDSFNKINEETDCCETNINDNWSVKVISLGERAYRFELLYRFTNFKACELSYEIDFDELSDFDILCGRSVIEEIVEEFTSYICSNISLEKVESIVNEVAKSPYINFNSTYIGKGLHLRWLKSKDKNGREYVEYNLLKNGKPYHIFDKAALYETEKAAKAIHNRINK